MTTLSKIQMFKDAAKDHIENLEITESTELDELALDSLDIVEIQVYLEETYNVKFKDIDTKISTVGDLLELIE